MIQPPLQGVWDANPARRRDWTPAFALNACSQDDRCRNRPSAGNGGWRRLGRGIAHRRGRCWGQRHGRGSRPCSSYSTSTEPCMAFLVLIQRIPDLVGLVRVRWADPIGGSKPLVSWRFITLTLWVGQHRRSQGSSVPDEGWNVAPVDSS